MNPIALPFGIAQRYLYTTKWVQNMNVALLQAGILSPTGATIHQHIMESIYLFHGERQEIGFDIRVVKELRDPSVLHHQPTRHGTNQLCMLACFLPFPARELRREDAQAQV
jgi:hypothetical protein